MRRAVVLWVVLAVVLSGCGDEPGPRAAETTRDVAARPAMSDDDFWALVQQSLVVAGDDQDRQAEDMRRRLAKLPAERIVAYDRAFQRREDESYSWDMWAAAYIVNGGCSDDCFDYFRFWLISRGRAVFEKVLADPGTVGEFIESGEETQSELFGSPSLDAYTDVTGDDIPPREIPRLETPAGKPWDEATVDRLYPALAKRFSF